MDAQTIDSSIPKETNKEGSQILFLTYGINDDNIDKSYNDEDLIEVPISQGGYDILELESPQSCEVPKNDNEAISVVHDAHQLTLSERKEGWIIRSLDPTEGNRSDKSYIHVKTDLMFRSLIEVYDFIIHCKLPKHIRGDKTIGPRRARVDHLIVKAAVGFHNTQTNKKFRTGNKIHIENNKRKRGADTLSIEIPDGFTHILYDLEVKERPT